MEKKEPGQPEYKQAHTIRDTMCELSEGVTAERNLFMWKILEDNNMQLDEKYSASGSGPCFTITKKIGSSAI